MQISVDYDPSGFEPLASHPLGKRWLSDSGEATTNLPPNQLHPLATHDSSQLWQAIRPLIDIDHAGLEPTRFRNILPFDASGDPAGIRQVLVDFLPRDIGDVLLSWTPFLGAVTTVDVFIDHWDAICRPGGDLVIWPANDQWTGYYRKDDQRLFLGTRNSA